QIVADEDFVLHPDKLRVMRRGVRQEVTGLVVNDKLSLSRRQMRRFRATLYQIEKDGPKGKTWGDTPDVLAAIHGFAHFVRMVDAERGAPLVARTQALLKKHRWAPDASPVRRQYSAMPAAPEGTTSEEKPKKPFWKLW
ncbi:MAG: RNA-directed DNA polymerase, partial [Bacteroidota bacterium]